MVAPFGERRGSLTGKVRGSGGSSKFTSYLTLFIYPTDPSFPQAEFQFRLSVILIVTNAEILLLKNKSLSYRTCVVNALINAAHTFIYAPACELHC